MQLHSLLGFLLGSENIFCNTVISTAAVFLIKVTRRQEIKFPLTNIRIVQLMGRKLYGLAFINAFQDTTVFLGFQDTQFIECLYRHFVMLIQYQH